MSNYVLTDGNMFYVFRKKKYTMDTWACYNQAQEFVSEIMWSEDDTMNMLESESLQILGDIEKAKLLLLKDGWDGIIV